MAVTFIMGFTVDENLLNVKGHRKVMNAVHRKTAQHHKTVTMPYHFTDNYKTQPGGEYGYAARTTAWMKRKKKMTGSEEPNVLYGDLRAEAVVKSEVTATQYRGRLTIRTPKYTRKGAKRQLTYERRREVEVVSMPERKIYANFMGRHYVQLANTQFKQYRRQRIR